MNAIDPRIHQALDGELAPAALSAEARRAVERHGGTIRVTTARGAGSTFTIELPA